MFLAVLSAMPIMVAMEATHGDIVDETTGLSVHQEAFARRQGQDAEKWRDLFRSKNREVNNNLQQFPRIDYREKLTGEPIYQAGVMRLQGDEDFMHFFDTGSNQPVSTSTDPIEEDYTSFFDPVSTPEQAPQPTAQELAEAQKQGSEVVASYEGNLRAFLNLSKDATTQEFSSAIDKKIEDLKKEKNGKNKIDASHIAGQIEALQEIQKGMESVPYEESEVRAFLKLPAGEPFPPSQEVIEKIKENITTLEHEKKIMQALPRSVSFREGQIEELKNMIQSIELGMKDGQQKIDSITSRDEALRYLDLPLNESHSTEQIKNIVTGRIDRLKEEMNNNKESVTTLASKESELKALEQKKEELIQKASEQAPVPTQLQPWQTVTPSVEQTSIHEQSQGLGEQGLVQTQSLQTSVEQDPVYEQEQGSGEQVPTEQKVHDAASQVLLRPHESPTPESQQVQKAVENMATHVAGVLKEQPSSQLFAPGDEKSSQALVNEVSRKVEGSEQLQANLKNPHTAATIKKAAERAKQSKDSKTQKAASDVEKKASQDPKLKKMAKRLGIAFTVIVSLAVVTAVVVVTS